VERINTRRQLRVHCRETVRLAWRDPRGDVKYASAKCLNVSERGISVELVEPVEVRSYVNLQSEKLKLTGTAAVRYCRRNAGKYLVGLEFSAGLRCSAVPEAAILS
jgi:hypothetical protein